MKPVRISLALTALVLLGVAVRGSAQAPTDQVPFKAEVKGAAPDFFEIPVSPSIGDARVTAKGEAILLGQVTWLEKHTVHFGVDGKPVTVSDGLSALTAASGDAIFISRSGLLRATAPGVVDGEGVYTITGGKGRFVGATGSGVVRSRADFSKNESAFIFEGTVSAPKQ